ncbi:shikimate dehydrogenase [Curvibacter sp. RS43]|uniref:Shikimate dehydrogenase (NADP(+)) n=1 Tax=Curvibacter microcysteis TaxID=3026419 RepID=A0ABT5M8Y7_9BURK|nr:MULTISPECIES: shikimate dehydrogenase [unclassified Curvibacter]MDD0812092.1 shikimate dehydrogenase [Curvibacter sp. RS43]MDD0813056.1 shikimate dehydrogenase [Curvibacter sp. HBC28]
MSQDTYCVLGNPVEHSRSPWIHARFAELTGQDLSYGRQRIELGQFAQDIAALQAAQCRGCNVTVPFKFEAAELAQHLSPRAQLAGAANVLSLRADGIHADNTDGIGLVKDIEHNANRPLAGQDVLLIGAGGAAAGVLGPLLDARPARLVVVNRTHAKALDLVARHQTLADRNGCQLEAPPIDQIKGDFAVVINATASSLSGAEVPVPASVLRPGSLALDMMYGPAAQGFLSWAAAHGSQGRDGLGMLVEQAAEAFEIWRGVRPPSAQVLAELRALL